jgi:uncharacterized protein YicC (UPF0701 family)
MKFVDVKIEKISATLNQLESMSGDMKPIRIETSLDTLVDALDVEVDPDDVPKEVVILKSRIATINEGIPRGTARVILSESQPAKTDIKSAKKKSEKASNK